MIKIYKNFADFNAHLPFDGEVFIFDFSEIAPDEEFPFKVEIAGERVLALFLDEDDAIDYGEWIQHERDLAEPQAGMKGEL